MTVMDEMNEMVYINPLAVNVNETEASLLRMVDPDHLADAVTRAVLKGPEVLPDPHEKGVASVVRAPRLHIPQFVAQILDGEKGYPGRVVRAALPLVLDDWDAGLYETSQHEEEGRHTVRMRMSGGCWAERAAWRINGKRRAGNRKGQWLWAGLGEGKGNTNPLWEIWDNGELRDVVAAPNLFSAASEKQTAIYHPDVLEHMWEIKEDRGEAEKYREL